MLGLNEMMLGLLGLNEVMLGLLRRFYLRSPYEYYMGEPV